MAGFVTVHKDLSKIKSKVAFSLSFRQLICFGTAAIIGVPVYLATRETIGNSTAVLLMMGLMLPLFFLAMYEKDGQPAEKVLRNIIRVKFYWPGIRHYKTENFYETLEKEGTNFATENKRATKTPVRKRPAGKRKSREHEKRRPK
jgi:hypothetical protein